MHQRETDPLLDPKNYVVVCLDIPETSHNVAKIFQASLFNGAYKTNKFTHDPLPKNSIFIFKGSHRHLAIEIWLKLLHYKEFSTLAEHLLQFDGSVETLRRVIERGIIQPYAMTQRSIADLSIPPYKKPFLGAWFSSVADATNKLRKALDQMPSDLIFNEEFSDLNFNADFHVELLKLLSKSTACKWPSEMLNYLYGQDTDGKELQFELLSETMKRETKNVVTTLSAKSINKYEIAEETKYQFLEEIFTTSFKFAQNPIQAEITLKDGFLENVRPDIIIKPKQKKPPKFQPPLVARYIDFAFRAKSPVNQFMRLAAFGIDQISVSERRNFEGFNSQTDHKTSYWLKSSQWLELLAHMLDRNGEAHVESNLSRDISKHIHPQRNEHIMELKKRDLD